jgi:hypothetical protein
VDHDVVEHIAESGCQDAGLNSNPSQRGDDEEWKLSSPAIIYAKVKPTAINRHETGHIECIDICKKAKGRGVGSISNVSNLKVGRQAQMRADLGCHSGLCKNTG